MTQHLRTQAAWVVLVSEYVLCRASISITWLQLTGSQLDQLLFKPLRVAVYASRATVLGLAHYANLGAGRGLKADLGSSWAYRDVHLDVRITIAAQIR